MSSEEEEMDGRTQGETDEGEGEGDPGEECPPPEEEEKEMLFLIEFLVDTLLLKPENMEIQDMDPCLLQGQTCIVLTFLHFPEMCICEKDVDPCKQTGANYIKYNAGKSLMFALSESQFENPPPIYLNVSAYKMLPHGSVPNKLPIGVTKICLSELFKQVFEKVDEKPEKLPLSKSIKDKYQLVGKRKKCPTAEVTIYIRLSCLGQNIVTEFQRGGNECEPFLFRSKESKKVYQCMPKDLPDDDAEDVCPPLPGWGMSLGKDCGDGAGGGGGGGAGGGGGGPCGGGGRGNGRGGGGGGGSRGGQDGGDDEDLNTGPELDDDDEFEEFGTEVHGHALTIKVQKSQKKQADDDQSLGKTDPSTSGKGRGDPGGQITFQVPRSQSLCSKGKAPNKAAVYNMNTSGGDDECGGGGGGLQLVQGIDSPDKDIFVLRIGKKGETSGKGKLELELRTPKPKIERNNDKPRVWDKAIQTEAEEKEGKGKKKKK